MAESILSAFQSAFPDLYPGENPGGGTTEANENAPGEDAQVAATDTSAAQPEQAVHEISAPPDTQLDPYTKKIGHITNKVKIHACWTKL